MNSESQSFHLLGNSRRILPRALVRMVIGIAVLGLVLGLIRNYWKHRIRQAIAEIDPQAEALPDDAKRGLLNPFLRAGAASPDGSLGACKQADAGDCFFLASLVALAEDPDGRALLQATIRRDASPEEFMVTFPNCAGPPVSVSSGEIASYLLTGANWKQKVPSEATTGDPDVRILEIAGDKVWKRDGIKPEGLWDDVSMNAFSMFTPAKQRLIWNPSRTPARNRRDIEKFRRLPQGTVEETSITSSEEAERALKTIIDSDSDGLCLAWLDNAQYHARTILSIDFSKRTFTYVNSSRGTEALRRGKLDPLLLGLARGFYALNYLEVPPATKSEDP